jgi:hypothetical protein
LRKKGLKTGQFLSVAKFVEEGEEEEEIFKDGLFQSQKSGKPKSERKRGGEGGGGVREEEEEEFEDEGWAFRQRGRRSNLMW